MFFLSGQGESLTSVTPDNICIPSNNKINKNPDTPVIRKERIGDTVNPRTRAKWDTVTDVEKYSLQKTPPYFRHKVDYEGNTYENNCCSDDSPTETDGCVINLDKEHENEYDEEFKEDTSVINITNES